MRLLRFFAALNCFFQAKNERPQTRGCWGHVTRTFDTEMLSLSLTGVSPFGPFMIRERPTFHSSGKTSITDDADLGGEDRAYFFFSSRSKMLTMESSSSDMAVLEPEGSLPGRVGGLGSSLVEASSSFAGA